MPAYLPTCTYLPHVTLPARVSTCLPAYLPTVCLSPSLVKQVRFLSLHFFEHQTHMSHCITTPYYMRHYGVLGSRTLKTSEE